MYIRDVRIIKYVLRRMDKKLKYVYTRCQNNKILKYVYTRCQNDKICIEKDG